MQCLLLYGATPTLLLLLYHFSGYLSDLDLILGDPVEHYERLKKFVRLD